MGARLEPNDVFDFEAFHGGSNIYISARDLDRWNASFSRTPILREPELSMASQAARVGKAPSGLTLGSWYRNADGSALWYSGHLQGFHNEVFRDSGSRLSLVYVSNNTIEPWLQKGLVVALRALIQGETVPQPTSPTVDEVTPESYNELAGRWSTGNGDTLTIENAGARLFAVSAGVRYLVVQQDPRFFYVPGLDHILAYSGRRRGTPPRLYVSSNLRQEWATRAR